MSNNLNTLYSLRRDFTIIGLTGRTGSGCSEVSKILSSEFNDLPDYSNYSKLDDGNFKQKYKIVNEFCSQNWKPYKVIEYKKVLLFLLLPKLLDHPDNKLLLNYFRTSFNDPKFIPDIEKLKKKIQVIVRKNENLIDRIKLVKTPNKVVRQKLPLLYDIFWGNEFNAVATEINNLLFDYGFVERKVLLHCLSNNFRQSGQPFETKKNNSQKIFYIAEVINSIIKATRKVEGKCHVVIDSLKNSLEIQFFKERYSAFYLIAVKNDNRTNDIYIKYQTKNEEDVKKLIEVDDTEYKCNDFQKGKFYAPDIQNCIQLADYHINKNPKKLLIKDREKNELISVNTFYTLEEQIMKLQTIIQQPGLITPEPIERIMQLAFTAKSNSGCISRQVGAVVTDHNFSVKAIGWNDVPKGSMPCSLRNVKELGNNGPGFTAFEEGKGIKETEIISEYVESKEIDKQSSDFNKFIKDNFNEKNYSTEKLNGRNCPYCFKSAYNTFSGEKNQVHTRSLHAEENAMLQISKYGGQGLEKGYLFTTASTCELCAKKAYQLGIKTIYYIDPYPGISRNHILKNNVETDPKMILFNGAVGRAYLKFYEPFMPQKDELMMISNHKLKEPENVVKSKIKAILKEAGLDAETKKLLDTLLKDNEVNSAKEIGKLLKKGLLK